MAEKVRDFPIHDKEPLHTYGRDEPRRCAQRQTDEADAKDADATPLEFSTKVSGQDHAFGILQGTISPKPDV